MEFEYQWNTWGSAQWRWYAPVALIVLLAAGGIIAYGVMAGSTVWMLGPVLSAVFYAREHLSPYMGMGARFCVFSIIILCGF